MCKQQSKWLSALSAALLVTSACGSGSAVPAPAVTVAFDPAAYRPAVGDSVKLTPQLTGAEGSSLRWWVETPGVTPREYVSTDGTSGISLVFERSDTIVTALDIGTWDVWAEAGSSSASVHIAVVRPAGSIPANARCVVDSECQSEAPKCVPNDCDGRPTGRPVCSTTCATTADCPSGDRCLSGACSAPDPFCDD